MTAVVSGYRYVLVRSWSTPIFRPKLVGWIGVNPSVADATRDDPTVRKIAGFSRRWGFDGFALVNLFPFVATDPRDLHTATPKERLGPLIGMNEAAVENVLVNVSTVVPAWGDAADRYPLERLVMLGRLERWHLSGVKHRRPARVTCLGKTKRGHPRHPARLAYATPLTDWRFT